MTALATLALTLDLLEASGAIGPETTFEDFEAMMAAPEREEEPS